MLAQKCASVHTVQASFELNLNGMYKVQHTKNPVAIIQCDHTMYIHSNKNVKRMQFSTIYSFLITQRILYIFFQRVNSWSVAVAL